MRELASPSLAPTEDPLEKMPPAAAPTIEFFKFISEGRPPQRADRAAGGTLPTRAFRYCEAATTASALGWYVFPPIGFRLYWTGTETVWTYAGASSWFPLGTAQFPGFREHFDGAAPDGVKGYAPPFIAALPEPGTIQVWSGLIARTRPGWSLLVRSPANMARAAGYDSFEGVIESDRWFGPLFINIRLTRTDSPIDFDANMPLFQVQPIQRETYSDAVLNDVTIRALDAMMETDWSDYQGTVVRPSQARCPLGTHAAEVRKRRHADYAVK